jgi:uncharacterized membrane-anchored protein
MVKNIINNIVDSFNNTKKGFSARKLTAFTFVMFAGYIHIEYVNVDNSIEALLIDAGTALLCLGIITMQNIINFKNGGTEPTKEVKEDEI